MRIFQSLIFAVLREMLPRPINPATECAAIIASHDGGIQSLTPALDKLLEALPPGNMRIYRALKIKFVSERCDGVGQPERTNRHCKLARLLLH